MIPNGIKRATRVSQKKQKSKSKGCGARALIAEVDRKLAQKSADIASQLVEKALKGDAPCTRLLMALSEQAESSEEVSEPKETASLALAWSKEPEWRGEACEADAETHAGCREPEN